MSPLLEVRDLEVHFLMPGGTVQAVRGVTFHVDQGESVALVGESGSGKSVTAQAIMGLVELPGHVVAGEVVWKGRPLSTAGRGEVERIRGRELAIVFQDPMTSLNPLLTIGVQITEVLRRHLRLGRRQATQRAVELLDLVGVSSPRQRLGQRPHELSGGMRQRVLIAIALACEPDLLIADEPTTALDVTIQAQILELLGDLRERLGLSLLLITHDLGVVAGTCDRVLVMYAGRLVEAGTADELFARPAHPYTAGLLRSTPRVDVVHPRLIGIEGSPPDLSAPPAGCAFHPRCPVAIARCRQEPPVPTPRGGREVACWNAFAASGAEATVTGPGKAGRVKGTPGPLLRVEGLTVNYPAGRAGWLGRERLLVQAVDDVSFTIAPGETLGLVGETGSGKTTTGRAVLRRVPLAAGRIWFDGRDITGIGGRELRRLRARMQLVFQDPYASLNPRMTVGEIVAEPLVVHRAVQGRQELRERVQELLRLVGLPPDAASRYPMAFSGGQRQRIGIARALALRPDLVVADEPVSALDVSIRAQVVNLMQDLQEQLGLAYLFIAHDLAVVRHISHRVAIMYAGRIVELAGRDDIYERPLHPYTRALLSAVPIPDPAAQRERRRVVLRGEIPSPIRPPAGCRFHTRCPLAEARCRVERPPLVERHPGHQVACWLA